MNTDMQTVTIKKGNHYSHWFPRLWMNKDEWTATFVFTESCRYSISYPDQEDWNKLFGVSFGFSPHVNSARWGWRFNPTFGVIELCPYVYEKEGRFIAESAILRWPTNQPIKLGILKSPFGAENLIFIAEGQSLYSIMSPTKNWGIKLEPYFGGNQTAPHDIHILTDW